MAEQIFPVVPSEPHQGEAGFDLRETLSFVWRQWKFALGVMVISLLAGTIYLLHQTPMYTATTQVLLDSAKDRPLGSDAILADPTFDVAMIEGQMAVIGSTVLLRRVVEKEHLVPQTAPSSPAPAPTQNPSMIDGVLSWMGSVADSVWGDHPVNDAGADTAPVTIGGEVIPSTELNAIEGLKSAVKVTRGVQQGYALAISVTSPDPARAAQLANAVADAYLVDKLDTRFEAAKRASAWLSDRLQGLRQQLRDSEEAVARFRADHGLVQSGGTGTLNQQQLSDLNAKLIDAKTDLAQKKARVAMVNSAQVKGDSLQNIPDITNSGALPNLRQQAANLSAQEADLLAHYGPSHPLVVNIRAQLGDVEHSIATETQRMAASIKNDFELAQAHVDSLQKAVDQATGQNNLDDATAIKLRELERTATVNKTLFEDFLKQAKITDEQATFAPQEIRIITPALPPGVPSSPRKLRFLIINAVIGLLLGVGGALAKEKLNAGFTTPKQVEDILGLPLLTSVSQLSTRVLRGDGSAAAPIHEYPIARPLSRYGEAIRALRSGIQMTDVDHPPKIIQITSAVPGEGKTTIALSLAASAGIARLKTLFIDADLRHPTATRLFGLLEMAGLVDVLLGAVDADAAIKFEEKTGYWVLGAGSTTQSPSDLLGSERMRSLVADLKETYDVIFIDTPPAGPVIDPVVVSHLSDKIVLVVRWAATARELVRSCVEQLGGHKKIAGVAFNRVNVRQAQKYGKHAHSYYYGNRYYKKYYTS